MDISNPEKDYKRSRHSVYSCQYHVIFTPKFRRKVLEGAIAERLKQCFVEIAGEGGFQILEQEIMSDHVHLLLSVDPDFGVTTAVSRLKGRSSRVLRKEFPHLKSRLPCMWTSSKFISSVGSVTLEVVKRYIEEQKHV